MTSQIEHPLRPPPGIDWVDQICMAADQRERMQAQQPDLMQFMMMQMQMQNKILAALAALVARMDDKPTPKQSEAKAK